MMTNRYQRGKIYAIRSHSTEQIYVGSTCEPTLARRMAKHKASYKQFQRIGGSCASSKFILQFNDAYIELLELFPCEFKDELQRREGELIRANTGNCVNRKIEGRTRAEHYLDNRESLKQYKIDNRESIKTWHKQHYLDNRESIKALKAQRIQCSYCNTSFARGDKSQHIKTIKHQNNYKISYLECFGEVFDGIIGNQDF